MEVGGKTHGVRETKCCFREKMVNSVAFCYGFREDVIIGLGTVELIDNLDSTSVSGETQTESHEII